MQLSTLGLAELRVDGVPSLAELISREGALYKIIVEGQAFQKLTDKGKLQKDFFLRFDPSLHTLYAGKKKVIDVESLKEVRIGFLTHTLLDHAETHHVEEDCAFSLVYDETGSSLPSILNLVSPTKEKRQMWGHAINVLIQTLGAVNAEAYSLMRPWAKALRKGQDCLDWKATNQLLESLNISVRMEQLEGFSKKDKFHLNDFIRVVRQLRSHPKASELFAEYGRSNIFSSNFDAYSNPLMNLTQFREFLKQQQGQVISGDEAADIIRRYSMGSGKMDEFAFQNWIVSADNDIWDPEKLRHNHDMTRPLNFYWINSSHNTYLSGGQLNGVSSIEMYIRVLKSGCRCLEIDIWDGPSGEPIVYHGYTLTSKIHFRDVLRVIKSHGFVASPYPIILSFENHCSKAVQDKMAGYIHAILGDLVMRYDEEAAAGREWLPSPAELQRKVLIKGSSHVTSVTEDMEELEELGAELNEAALGGMAMSREEIQFVQDKVRGKKKGAAAKDQEHISHELEQLIYLKARKLAKFPLGYDDSFRPNHMTSFSENRINRILATEAGFQHVRKFNSSQISRVYPKGTRFDSSNYDPILYWYAGCQMLALNFQTSTTAPMLVNWAKFRENAGVGYNERPEYLNTVVRASGSVQCGELFAKVEKFKRPEPVCSKVRIRVFGARMLPRGNACIEVALHDGGSSNEMRYRTNVAKSETFSPDFDFDKTFPIVDSANAFFSFVAISKEQDFAYFCIPLESMRDGYRAVHLVDSLYDPLAKGMCHVLVHIEKIP